MEKIKAKENILMLIAEAEELIPKNIEPDLPSSPELNGEPKWHNYENEIWKIGEAIRKLLKENKALYKDKELFERIISVSLNRNSKRGRQSFIMLLWNKQNTQYAEKLVSQLDDKFVYGFIIKALNKMKTDGYSAMVKPFDKNKITSIRNQAKKYLQQFGC
jgi:hypothetical protein